MSTQRPIIQGTYSDFKTVKSRKVLQIIVEVPIENMQQALNVLGAPNPHAETHVAIAPLKPEATEGKPTVVESKQPAPLAQKIAILCQEQMFIKFLNERVDWVSNKETAAECIRRCCKVKSRSEIEANQEATAKWESIYSQFQAWKEAA